MKRYTQAVWFLAGLMLLLNACVFGGHDSSASGSAWQPYLVLKAPGSPSAMSAARDAADQRFHRDHPWYSSLVHDAYAATVNSPACPGIGTVSPPSVGDDSYEASSCSGLLYRLSPCPTQGSSCVIGGLASGQSILFDQAGCQGDEAVSPNFNDQGTPSISSIAVTQGAVFRYDPGSTGASDPATYLMLPPSSPVVPFTVRSVYAYDDGGCQDTGPVQVSAYALEPNDPAVSGLDSAPIAGPVSVGTP